MWDERYGLPGYFYGTEPNDFLRSVVDQLPRGRALCLAEGEGRNAVFLAERGFDVVAVDQSAVGLAKAERLAVERGQKIHTITANLDSFEIETSSFSVIVSIWAHVPPTLRKRLHAACVAGLDVGGMFVLEAYTPAQLAFGTGGPPVAELMMTLDALRGELSGLELIHAQELEREVNEGDHHFGHSAVVQVLARRQV